MSSTVLSAAPAWTIPDYLEVHDGHLAINGVDALELVSKYESPLFVFSEPRIRVKHQPAQDQQPIPSNIQSVSSMPRRPTQTWPCFKTVLNSGIDVEVNSGGELFKALRIGFPSGSDYLQRHEQERR